MSFCCDCFKRRTAMMVMRIMRELCVRKLLDSKCSRC